MYVFIKDGCKFTVLKQISVNYKKKDKKKHNRQIVL